MTMLLSAVLAACVPGCASKVSQPAPIPPVADLKRQAEPAIPPAVFEVGADRQPTARAIEAEEAYNDRVLLWGRGGWDAVGRLCGWAKRVFEGVPAVEALDCRRPPPQ